MPHNIRILCTSDNVPTIRRMFSSIRNQNSFGRVGTFAYGWLFPILSFVLPFRNAGMRLELDPSSKEVDRFTSDWERIGVVYQKEKPPFFVEIHREGGAGQNGYRETIERLKKSLKASRSKGRERALQRLAATKFIVSFKISEKSLTKEGHRALGYVAQFFVRRCDGMVQKDGEGLYENGELIAALH